MERFKIFLSGYRISGISSWYERLPAALLPTAKSQMHGVSLNSDFESLAISTVRNPQYSHSTAALFRTAVTVVKGNDRTHHPNVVNVHQRAGTRLRRLQYVRIIVPVVFC